MLSPRWKKIAGDVAAARGRFSMMIAAIAMSVCLLTAICAAYVVLTREVSRNYLSTHPASAQLELSNVDEALVQRVRGRPNIADAQASGVTVARIEVGENEWLPLRLFVVADFQGLRINAFHRESGPWPPPVGSMLIERSALELTGAKVGAAVSVQTANGGRSAIKIAGLVHDPGLAPAWQEQTVYGYITPATLELLGEQPTLQLLKIAIRDGAASAPAIEATARDLVVWLNANDHAVSEIRIPPPLRHPHQSQMTTVLRMLLIFSGCALVLGATLAATMIGGLLAQQVRQIAIMKAIGARSSQIAVLYLFLVGAIGAIAVAIGLPAGLLLGRGFTTLVAQLLNLDIQSFAVQWWILALIVLIGISMPVIAASIPILAAARRTIREAINDHGVAQHGVGLSAADRLVARIRNPDAALTLAIRNTFRRRARLILTLTLLAAAGAMFICCINLKVAWEKNVADAAAQRHYDIEIRLQNWAEQAATLALIAATAGVRQAESWNRIAVAADRGDHLEVARTYPDGGHGSLTLYSAPTSSTLAPTQLVEGRWLQSQDTEGVVLNTQARAQAFPDAKAGDGISLLVAGRPIRVRVVGVVRELLTPAAIYASPEIFDKAVRQTGRINAARIVLDDHNAAESISHALAKMLEDRGVGVATIITEKRFGMAQAGHVYILVLALAAIALAMAVVGLFGLATSLSASVIERTREFGVMRAIGARSSDVLKTVLIEGMLIGALSWVIAVVLSIPLSIQVGKVLTSISQQPLVLMPSVQAAGIWLGLVLIGSALAGQLPARRASALTVRETLRYA